MSTICGFHRIENIISPFVMLTGMLGLMLLASGCGRRSSEQPREEILARIGDKTISVNEFIRRAEYTLRPPYCNGDDYIQRKIVLNSLIAEKLLALEAGNQNELTENKEFQKYIRGRQEQAMRQWFYYHDFYEKAQPNTSDIKKVFNLAGRKYNIAYYTIKDSTIAKQVQQRLQQGDSFEQVFREFGGLVKIPQREVAWDAQEHPAIHQALFSEPLTKNQVIGPIQTDQNFYTVMMVQGWTDRVVISDTEIQQRWHDVRENLRTTASENAFEKMAAQLMKGKKLEFVKDTFIRLVNIVGKFYMKSDEEKKQAFNKQFWRHDTTEMSLTGFENDLAQLRNEPVLRLDGEVWSVQDLENEISVHPLVFRKRHMQKSEFGEQFKLAVADLIRDKFITQEAARRGYDRVNVIERNGNMWRDNLMALYQRNRYLAATGHADDFNRDYLKTIKTVLNPYIDNLQSKYDQKIEINTNRFEQTQLTRIDLFVLQQNVPYPILIPTFPLLTTDNQLTYGKKMK